jgi:hypothetical protein
MAVTALLMTRRRKLTLKQLSHYGNDDLCFKWKWNSSIGVQLNQRKINQTGF